MNARDFMIEQNARAVQMRRLPGYRSDGVNIDAMSGELYYEASLILQIRENQLKHESWREPFHTVDTELMMSHILRLQLKVTKCLS